MSIPVEAPAGPDRFNLGKIKRKDRQACADHVPFGTDALQGRAGAQSAIVRL